MPDAAHKLDLELATQSAGKENWNNFYLAAANIKAEALKKKELCSWYNLGLEPQLKWHRTFSIQFEVAGTVFYIPQTYFPVKTVFSLCQWNRCLTTCSQNWNVSLKKQTHYLSCRRYAILQVNLEEEDNVKRDRKIISGKVKTVNLMFLDFAKHLIFIWKKIIWKKLIFTKKKSVVKSVNENLSKLF